MLRPAYRAYVVLLHVALAMAAYRSSPATIALVRNGIDHPNYTARIEQLRATQEPVDALAPDGVSVFLGDSITAGLAGAAIAPASVNFGIGGQRSDHLVAGMGAYRSMSRAARVFVMIGVNDVAQGREEGIGERYRQLLAKIPAGVPVVMSSPSPVRGREDQGRHVAQQAAAACAQDSRCLFVDAFAALSTPGAQADDGVHLTVEGYRLWARALVEALRSTRHPAGTAPARHSASG